MRPWILRSAFPLAGLTTLIFVYIPFHRLGEGAGKAALYAEYCYVCLYGRSRRFGVDKCRADVLLQN